jgi:Uma2 family endonuclease
MATVTRLKLGPADRDRPLTYDEFMAADYELGYVYELIDGKLYMSPKPNPPHDRVERWLYHKLTRYSDKYPEVVNYVSSGCRVIIPNRPGDTTPEPDITAFRDYPLDLPFDELRWQDLRPVLVVEVVSEYDPEKDLLRNVELYFNVTSIKEYWVVDTQESWERPTFIAHRRHGKQWRVKHVAFGETYTTKLLPGFELLIDPRRR